MDKMKNVWYYLIPIFLILRIGYFTTNKLSEKSDIIEVKTKIISSRGRIQKKDGKYPLNREYVRVNKLKDGDYILKGEIIAEKYSEYTLKVLEFEYIEEKFLKKLLRKRVEKINANSTYAQKNIHMSVITGDRSGLADKVKKSFSKAGISHILAISGLHIGILIVIFNWIFLK
ncbi:MAG: ComEC/Rec2 family competence protein, partial [Fusobacteriaceae bacterium]